MLDMSNGGFLTGVILFVLGYIVFIVLALLVNFGDTALRNWFRPNAARGETHETVIQTFCSEHFSDVQLECETTCPICLDIMNPGETVKELQCKHCYHSNCLLGWVTRDLGGKAMKCPMCRQTIVSEDLTAKV